MAKGVTFFIISIIVSLFIIGCSKRRVEAAGSLAEMLQGAPESWSIIDANELNARVEEAIAAEESWPRSPLLLVLHLIGGDMDTKSLVIEEVKNRGEGADATKIVCIRDGFLDDSVRGDWHEIDLRRLSDGTWRVQESRVAVRCWRSENTDVYQGKPCP